MALRLRDTRLFLPLRLGPTAAGALQEFIDIDVTAGDLVRLLKANRSYQELFASFVQQSIRRRGEVEEPVVPGAPPRPAITTHRLIGLLGMVGSRNLIIALRMFEAVHGQFPLDAEGNLDLKPGSFLKYSLRAEEYFQNEGIEYPETAFAGGLLFDWIAFLAQKNGTEKKLLPFLDETWKHALRAGIVAYELGRRVPGQAPKHCLAGALLMHAGRVLQAEATDTYAEFARKTDADKRLDPLARLILERESFGFSGEEISAYLLNFFSVFQELRPVIRHYREPFVLKGRDPARYREASLLLLADTLARSWRMPAGETDKIWEDWAPLARKALKLKNSVVEDALKAAMAHR